MEEKKSSPQEKPAHKSYIKYSALGFQMIGVIGVFTYVGLKIDETQNNKTQIFTGFLSLLGVIVSLYLVLRGLKSK